MHCFLLTAPFLIAIAAPGSDGNQCTDRVIVRPTGKLTTASAVALDLEIWTLTSPPHMEQPTQFVIDGNQITIDIYPDGGPIDLIGHFVETVMIGQLPADSYTYTVIQHASVDCGDQVIEGDLCVEAADCQEPSCRCPVPVRPLYTIIDIGTLGGGSANALAINESGQIAGSADDANFRRHAYVWHAGTMTDLGSLDPFPVSEAWGISDTGAVTGILTHNGFDTRGFLWQDGLMIDIGDLGGPNTNPKDINAAGQIVGSSELPAFGPQLAFRWQDGEFENLGALGEGGSDAWGVNESGQVVGCTALPLGETSGAFLWTDGEMTALPSLGGSSCAFAVNDHGQVVGEATTGAIQSGFQAVRWDGDEVTNISELGGFQQGFAWGINNAGSAVGWGGSAAIVKPFIHHPVDGMRDLRDLLEPDTGWFWLQPRDINDAGQIVGSGIRDVYRGFLMTPIDADFDDDGDTDLFDMARLQQCMPPVGQQIPPECATVDIDRSGELDLDDHRAFHFALTGP